MVSHVPNPGASVLFPKLSSPSPLASLFRVVYAFHITWSGLVFQASPNLSSRRNYDQEGLGRRPYKNLENFCLMINNLRLIIINSKRNNSYFKAGGGGGGGGGWGGAKKYWV